ncbi:MAG: MarR family winged helix-turn-helix transcriptional regulator [Actinomycetes bacterium]
MVQPTKDRKEDPVLQVPGDPAPAKDESAQRELVDLADALRDVMIVARRKSAGSAHDKSVLTLLWHLMTFGPLRASELADRSLLDLSTVSRHLSALESDGYITRTADPADGRAHLLAVTKSGQKLVRQARAQRLAMLADALKGWSDADRSDLIRLIRQLADSLETL